jgi:hypothetical protein
MGERPIGEQVETLKEAFGRMMYLKDVFPKGTSYQIYVKYKDYDKADCWEGIKKNLEVLFFLQNVTVEDLVIISGMDEARINFLIGRSAAPSSGTNPAVTDFIHLAVILTAHTGRDWENIFNPDYHKELRHYGLLARNNSEE